MSVLCLPLLQRIYAPLITYCENLWSTLSLDTNTQNCRQDYISYHAHIQDIKRDSVFKKQKKKSQKIWVIWLNCSQCHWNRSTTNTNTFDKILQPATLHIERKFKTLFLLINTCIFSLFLPFILVFSLTKTGLPVLEQNNRERKLHLEAVYAVDGAPGLMTERKYSCPRNEHYHAPHSLPPPRLSPQHQVTCSEGFNQLHLLSAHHQQPHSAHHDKDHYFSAYKRVWKQQKICILQSAQQWCQPSNIRKNFPLS